jgi:hypothetical protein
MSLLTHRPEIFVSDLSELVEAHAGLGRIELQVEGRGLDGLLLVAGQAREAVGEVPAIRLSSQQQCLAGNQDCSFLLLRLLQLGIIPEPRPASYRRMPRRRLCRNNFKHCTPHVARIHDCRTVNRTVSRNVLITDRPQGSTRLTAMAEDRGLVILRGREEGRRLHHLRAELT